VFEAALGVHAAHAPAQNVLAPAPASHNFFAPSNVTQSVFEAALGVPAAHAPAQNVLAPAPAPGAQNASLASATGAHPVLPPSGIAQTAVAPAAAAQHAAFASQIDPFLDFMADDYFFNTAQPMAVDDPAQQEIASDDNGHNVSEASARVRQILDNAPPPPPNTPDEAFISENPSLPLNVPAGDPQLFPTFGPAPADFTHSRPASPSLFDSQDSGPVDSVDAMDISFDATPAAGPSSAPYEISFGQDPDDDLISFSPARSASSASYRNPIDLHDEDNLVLNVYGPWSRRCFGLRVYKIALEQGDASAIRFVIDGFPQCDLKDAWLWVEYIKSAFTRAGDFDLWVMDRFRFKGWFGLLLKSHRDDYRDETPVYVDLFPSFFRVQLAFTQSIVCVQW
ncbi:hypothetical protein AURDEDRAFT_176474, partial [Auricularia subglabra TFB-10046 SS5]